MRAKLFANDLIGDHTLVTAKIGEDTLSIKAPKDFDASFDSDIGIAFEIEKLYLFDAAIGARIRR